MDKHPGKVCHTYTEFESKNWVYFYRYKGRKGIAFAPQLAELFQSSESVEEQKDDPADNNPIIQEIAEKVKEEYKYADYVRQVDNAQSSEECLAKDDRLKRFDKWMWGKIHAIPFYHCKFSYLEDI